MVERQDWNYPVPVAPGESGPLPGSKFPVPDPTPSQQLVELEAEWAANEPDSEVLDHFADHQVEVIQTAVEMNLATLPAGFAEAFDQCPQGVTPATWLAVRRKVAGVLAQCPHLRGERLFKKCFNAFTLEETVAADEWLAQNPQLFG
jgi:hypothetical protein